MENGEVAEGDFIERDTLQSVIEKTIKDCEQRFTVNGSVLDYRIKEFVQVLNCTPEEGRVQYNIDFEWPSDFPTDNKSQEKSRVQDTFLRAGLAKHPNLDTVMDRLRMQDDVIIGIDTNVLWDCLFTSMLLDEIYKETFPNWILLAVPKLVMAETENAANNTFGGSHPRAGVPVYDGRVAQRALQEIMDIREDNPDRPGLAMITIGELEQNADVDRGNWKLDALIRNQFQEFLDDINFHKGTFFMSQDRVNVMMSGTEGADGLYLQKPSIENFQTDKISIDAFTGLVYELCIQFGTIRFVDEKSGETVIELTILWPGKQVSDWRNSRLQVRKLAV